MKYPNAMRNTVMEKTILLHWIMLTLRVMERLIGWYIQTYIFFLEGLPTDLLKYPCRQNSISLEDAKFILRALGRFHGISLAYRALDPAGFEQITDALEETYFAEKFRVWYIGFQKLAFKVAQDAVAKTYPNTKYESICENFLQESLYDDLIAMVSQKSGF